MLERSFEDFPTLSSGELVYLDNAASTQTPKSVIEKIAAYYSQYRSNVHRSFYGMASKATTEYEDARALTASYISAEKDNIIFTKNSTEAINLFAYSLMLSKRLNSSSVVCLSEMEHHSNLVPWLILKNYLNFQIVYLRAKKESYELDYEDFAKLCKSEKITLLSISHQSNITGLTTNVELLQEILRSSKQQPLILLDASQSAPHGIVNVKSLNVDAVVFTGHKLLGPTGTGVLWIQPKLIEELPPAFGGGEMVDDVSETAFTAATVPHNFEAGTQNISGVIGLGEAVKYLSSFDRKELQDHENKLKNYLVERINQVEDLVTLVPMELLLDRNLTQISFYIKGVHSHDVAQSLGERNICVRAGYHCAQLIFNTYQIPAVVRASLLFYNRFSDVDRLVSALDEIRVFYTAKSRQISGRRRARS
jgi:cysteine desulfurase/selenocysteine lyase